MTISFTKVKLPYGWLGNMSPHPIVVNGATWRTCEHLFQALRFAEDDPVRQEIQMRASPMAAKMHAKGNASRMVVVPQSDQDLDNMRDCLRLKLHWHPDLAEQLHATGTETIIEDCSSRARGSSLFWGAARQPDGTWRGQNKLGVLWMELRDHPGCWR